MTKITDTEIAYDISRIPAVRAAMPVASTGKIETGYEPAWEALLEAAVQVMDDGIREELHDQAGSLSPCAFLTIYAARHEAKYGARFDF